jgi:hypothetical protein
VADCPDIKSIDARQGVIVLEKLCDVENLDLEVV